ncbi:MAG TPA: hypothetical protein PK970_12745 [Hyphomicrobiaceae bacterium]|nr:hypothetical protein [Hyphomicrobiaceae bacterium]
MSLTYYEKLKYRHRPIFRSLLALNFAIGTLVLIAWQTAVLIVLDPLSWAASSSFPRERGWEALFEYPMALFWLVPSAAIVVGWMAVKSRQFTLAVGIMLAPVLIAMLTVGLYWFLPPEIR